MKQKIQIVSPVLGENKKVLNKGQTLEVGTDVSTTFARYLVGIGRARLLKAGNAETTPANQSTSAEEDEAEQIRQQLRDLGVKFHPNLGLEKLRALLDQETEEEEE